MVIMLSFILRIKADVPRVLSRLRNLSGAANHVSLKVGFDFDCSKFESADRIEHG